ncbi:hypothetical protein AB4142_29745, partial [Variovorax sp. 2RAF20]
FIMCDSSNKSVDSLVGPGESLRVMESRKRGATRRVILWMLMGGGMLGGDTGTGLRHRDAREQPRRPEHALAGGERHRVSGAGQRDLDTHYEHRAGQHIV